MRKKRFCSAILSALMVVTSIAPQAAYAQEEEPVAVVQNITDGSNQTLSEFENELYDIIIGKTYINEYGETIQFIEDKELYGNYTLLRFVDINGTDNGLTNIFFDKSQVVDAGEVFSISTSRFNGTSPQATYGSRIWVYIYKIENGLHITIQSDFNLGAYGTLTDTDFYEDGETPEEPEVTPTPTQVPEEVAEIIANENEVYGVYNSSCRLSGTYTSSNPDTIEEELESIEFSIQNPEIAEIADFSYLLSVDRKEASWYLNLNCKNVGDTIVDINIPDSDIEGLAVPTYVEPELELPKSNITFVNDYDCNLTVSESDYLSIKVSLNSPDEEYLENFLSSIKVEIAKESESSINNAIADISNQSYIIADSGNTGEYIIPIETNAADHVDNVITITTPAQKKTVRIMYDNPLIDSDGDGIPDDWEVNGLDIDKDGAIDLDLPAMGAFVGHKDIFVEVDKMKELSISQESLDIVAEQFMKHGYYLHIDAGADSIDYVTGKKWGDLSESNYIPYSDITPLYNGSNYSPWAELIEANFNRSRRAVFRHCLYVNAFNNQGTSGITFGKSGLGGQYFVITTHGFGNDGDNRTRAMAGTFMHELGHVLGLRHGGTDNVNYKPNHLSIMNYMYQFSGLYGTDEINYSEYKLPALNENSINEYNGIDPDGILPDTNLGARWKIVTNAGEEEYKEKNIAGKAIDFNGDGNLESSLKLEFYHGNEDAPKPENGIISQSINEWDALKFNGGDIGDLGASSPISKIVIDPEDVEKESISVEEAIELGIFENVYDDSHTHILTKVNENKPTCTTYGNITYYKCESCGKLFEDEEGNVEISESQVIIPATGHAYEYTDNGDGTHDKTCAAGDDTATEPHIYQDGICKFCGAKESEEHVHEYGSPEIKWSEDYTACTMVFTCKDGDDRQSIECEVTDEVTNATCTEKGKVIYTAKGTFTGKEYTDVKEAEIPATGHVYGTPEFNWSRDYQSCTAVFTCGSCNDEQEVKCTITCNTTDPTCTEDGKTVYTATASFADKEYTDTRKDVIPATGHTYEYTDNGDGTHTKACTAGDDTTTEPHTYKDGICTFCRAEEPKEHVHKYGSPEFKWSEDNTACTMVFTCKDGDDQQSIECEITDKITDATCTENGKAVYTAKGTFAGKEYMDVKEVNIPATGHAYGTPEFSWSKDHQNCTAIFVCGSCGDEQEIGCTITSETTDPSCIKDGKVVYTATVSFVDKEYTDTQVEAIPATGHTYEYTDSGNGTHTKVCTAGDDMVTEPHTYQDGTCTYCGAEEPEGHTHKYGEPEFTWSDDYRSCTATFTCADGDDRQIVECQVTSVNNGDRTITYTATVEFNGESYAVQQKVAIKEGSDEKPDAEKPAESGDKNNPGNPSDANKGTSANKAGEKSVSNVQTGDGSNQLLWSVLFTSMIGAGVVLSLLQRRHTK